MASKQTETNIFQEMRTWLKTPRFESYPRQQCLFRGWLLEEDVILILNTLDESDRLCKAPTPEPTQATKDSITLLDLERMSKEGSPDITLTAAQGQALLAEVAKASVSVLQSYLEVLVQRNEAIALCEVAVEKLEALRLVLSCVGGARGGPIRADESAR